MIKSVLYVIFHNLVSLILRFDLNHALVHYQNLVYRQDCHQYQVIEFSFIHLQKMTKLYARITPEKQFPTTIETYGEDHTAEIQHLQSVFYLQYQTTHCWEAASIV